MQVQCKDQYASVVPIEDQIVDPYKSNLYKYERLGTITCLLCVNKSVKGLLQLCMYYSYLVYVVYKAALILCCPVVTTLFRVRLTSRVDNKLLLSILHLRGYAAQIPICIEGCMEVRLTLQQQ